MKLFFFISLLLFSTVYGQQLEIGILRSYKVTAADVSYNEGDYAVMGDTLEIARITSSKAIRVQRNGEKVKVVQGDKSLGSFDTVRVEHLVANSSFKIQGVLPSANKSRKYKDDLIITSDGTYLTIVNHVEMENYLGGVIESEGGSGKHLEYYKVQAILSRTYSLDHLYKHAADGFHLCDGVHCQAYHNMLRYSSTIAEAVEATKGLVMLSPDMKLAKSFFHANCGGQTSESDFVWNEPISYCKSVKDTFCTSSWQSTWTKKINLYQWESFLTKKYGYPSTDSLLSAINYYFDQPNRRAFYIHPWLGIPLRDLRTEFKLKSTWFSCERVGNEVILHGHGFGHGVGLCQEGAMAMANKGYNFEQILKFYFTGVEMMNYYDWLFLRQDANLNVGL